MTGYELTFVEEMKNAFHKASQQLVDEGDSLSLSQQQLLQPEMSEHLPFYTALANSDVLSTLPRSLTYDQHGAPVKFMLPKGGISKSQGLTWVSFGNKLLVFEQASQLHLGTWTLGERSPDHHHEVHTHSHALTHMYSHTLAHIYMHRSRDA